MAILLNPHLQLDVQPIFQEKWNPRFLAIKWNYEKLNIIIINIYASNSAKERNIFFNKLSAMQLPEHDLLIIGGDFNFTENNNIDRLKVNNSTSKNESIKEFLHLKEKFKITDAINKNNRQKQQHMTFFGPHGAARLDRFYISSKYLDWVVQVKTRIPTVKSDHRQIWLTLKNPKINIKYKINRKLYPQHWSSNEWEIEKFQDKLKFLLYKLKDEIKKKGTWDEIKREIRLLLIEYKLEYAAKHVSQLTIKLKDNKKALKSCKKIEEVQSIQKKIIDIKRKKKQTTSEIKYKNFLLDPKQGYKNLFQRMSNKEINPLITNLLGDPKQSNENRMATKWKEIMSCTKENRNKRRWLKKVFKTMPWKTLSGIAKEELVKSITEKEVSQAIDKLKRFKSGGDDGLPNDFYKDFKTIITPILTKLFNSLWQEGNYWESMSNAILHPLKKKGNSSNPMDYRPIALLNSDYKILTRLLAERLKPFLQELVSINQSGFVPERKIEEAIDKMKTGMELIKIFQGESGALMVDLAKAYDTLERFFLLEVLTRMGFPAHFINLIKVLHQNTTAQFIINGYLSDKFPVVRGIRQGCPLAPLLFILATEVLIAMIKQEENKTQISTSVENCQLNLSTIGFVDDTTVFYKDLAALKLIISKIELFGILSGLKVQPTKSKLISYYQFQKTTYLNIPILQKNEIIRFLGIGIGLDISTSQAWEWFLTKTMKRLILLTQKTSSVQQRIILCQSIIQAQFRFYASYYFPTENIIKSLEQIQKNYIWHNIASKDIKNKHRLSKELLQASKKDGGLGLPSLKQILYKLSIMRITVWVNNPKSHHGMCIRFLLALQINRHSYDFLPDDIQTQIYIQAVQQKKKNPIIQDIFLSGAINLQSLLLSNPVPQLPHDWQLQRIIWYNNLEIKWQSEEQLIVQLSSLSLISWNLYKQRVPEPIFHPSFIKQLRILNNPLVVDLNGKILLEKNFPFIKKSTMISQIFDFKEVNFNPFKIKILLKAMNTKVKNLVNHLIKLLITRYPGIAAQYNRIKLYNNYPEYHHSKWEITTNNQNNRKLSCISKNENSKWWVKKDGITCISTESAENSLIIQPHAKLVRIIINYKKEKKLILGFNGIKVYETWNEKLAQLTIYDKLDEKIITKINSKWEKMERNDFDLQKEVKYLFSSALHLELEKSWDSIFFFRLLTCSLKFWYLDREPQAQCQLCNKGADNMKHLFSECEITLEIYKKYKINQKTWYDISLTNPIFIVNDPILSKNYINYYNWNIPKSNELTTKIKLILQ